VELCGSTEQVVTAIKEALANGLRITFRGGGHCYENFVSGNQGGVIIDLSPMGEVYRDPGSGLYCVEGGATLWNVYTRLEREFGVTIPAGSCYSVGAGGHVTAGGYGLLARLYGLTVDYLSAVEVVTVDRDGNVGAVTVGRDSPGAAEKELLWAHQGGGGGNFGIVTKFWFEDPPEAPEYAELATVAWNWASLDEGSFKRLVGGYGEWLAANSEVDGPYSGLFSLLHLNHAKIGASPQITLTAQHVGNDPAPLAKFLEAMEADLPPVVAAVRPGGHPHALASSTTPERLPWLFVTQTLNGSGPNRRGKYKSAYMIEAFPEGHLEAMWEALSTNPPPAAQTLLQVDSYGGRVNAVAPGETAVAQRSSTMKLQFQTYWHEAAQEEGNLEWIRRFYDAMYGAEGPLPDGTVDGCYVGYPDVDLQDWQWLYYKENYEKLQQVKATWDPGDVFNHAQSIELPD
jgi:FAD/FMN-containing dehydrogenase